jgi:adenylosuccinate lyase
MCGRTHGQPGQPVTFGFKAAVWASELARHRTRLAEAAERIQVVQLGGALGTMEFWDARAERLLARFAERLGLGVPDMAWLTARDRVAEFLNLLALVTATLAKIGQEVYTLQRPEIGELGEPWEPGQVGSITMPHKRNPEASEHLDTLARIARAAAGVLIEGMASGHERDGRAWKAEWMALPEVALTAGTAAALAVDLAGGLVVHADRMRDNLYRSGRRWASERVLAQLSSRLGPRRAQELMQAALAAADDRTDLCDVLAAEGVAPAADLDAWTDEPALATARAMVDAVLARGTPGDAR